MRILFNLTHPAHVLFFKYVIPMLRGRGHEIKITTRRKDVTVELLEELGWECELLTTAGGNPLSLFLEMLVHVARLVLVVLRYKPTLIIGKHAVYGCQVGWLLRIPSITFDDTDDAKLQQRLSFPFATKVYTSPGYPRLSRKQTDLPGCAPLAYLHPDRFKADVDVLKPMGLSKRKYTIIRLVSWQASHDIGESGFESTGVSKLVDRIDAISKVVISSESVLPETLREYALNTPANHFVHVLANARLYIGEGCITAAEAVVLGVPTILVNSRKLAYVEEFKSLGLLWQVENSEEASAIADRLLREKEYQEYLYRHHKYISQSQDLVNWIVNEIEEFNY